MNGRLVHLQHLPPSLHRDNSEQGGHCSHATIDEIVSQVVKTMKVETSTFLIEVPAPTHSCYD